MTCWTCAVANLYSLPVLYVYVYAYAYMVFRLDTLHTPSLPLRLFQPLSCSCITCTKRCCNANNNNEKEGIADTTKLIKKLIFILLLNKEADLKTAEAIQLIGYWLS